MTYPQTLALTDRLNYLSAMMHRHALVGVIEEAMGIELSDRIRYIRTIMDELQRIDSHLLYLGCTAQDLGALTAFLYCMRDREHVLNVMEETTGGRLIQNYYRIGGLQADIDPNFVQNVKTLCKYHPPTIQEYLLMVRMTRAKELLENPSIKIQEVAARVGYSDNNYFSKAFRNFFGITPTDCRNKCFVSRNTK